MRTVWHVTVIGGEINTIGDKIAKFMNEGWYCSGNLVPSPHGMTFYQKMTKRERVY